MALSTPTVDYPQKTDLAGLLGDRYTENPFECSFYRRDLAPVPSILAKLIANNQPSVVTRPKDTYEIAAIVSYASQNNVAITPRAAATTVYWNAVPLRDGLLVDLTGLRGVISLDESRSTVRVLAGTRWSDLDAWLKESGFTLCSYPTSAPSATVGGWISMEGHGIGSLIHGGIEKLVTGLTVVLPDSRIVECTANSTPPLSWFMRAEGTLGIVTEVELLIRPEPKMYLRRILVFESLDALQGAAVAFAQGHPAPFYLHLHTREHLQLLKLAGFKPPAEQPMLVISYEGGEEEVSGGMEMIRDVKQVWGAVELPEERADQEWAERLFNLRVKRIGPTLLGAESWLPLGNLCNYEREVTKLARRQKTQFASYANVVTPTQIAVMSVYPSNESHALRYIFDLSLTNRLYRIAFRNGGQPYGIGFWNTPYLPWAVDRATRQERKSRKRQLDPQNIMNPGKVYAPPLIFSPGIYTLAMGVLAWLRSVLRMG